MQKIRDDIDYSKPINLKRLSPLKRISVAIAAKWRETDIAQKNRNRAMDAKYAKMAAKDALLKDALLATIYAELENNKSLKGINGESESVLLEVQRDYIYSLDRILGGSEFLLYNIRRVQEAEDFRACFEDMPILLSVTKRRMDDA